MYALTVLYGIWNVDSNQLSEQHTGWQIISTAVFTFLFTMMISSHILCVVTNPGEMPRNYEQLHEEELPTEFNQMISLRESLYAELVVKKKMRKGELTKEQIPDFPKEMERARASSRASRSGSGQADGN